MKNVLHLIPFILSTLISSTNFIRYAINEISKCVKPQKSVLCPKKRKKKHLHFYLDYLFDNKNTSSLPYLFYFLSDSLK